MRRQYHALAQQVRKTDTFYPYRGAFRILSESPSWAARDALSSLLDEPRAGRRAASILLQGQDGYHFVLRGLNSENSRAQLNCLDALHHQLPLIYPSLPSQIWSGLRHRVEALCSSADREVGQAAARLLSIFSQRRIA